MTELRSDLVLRDGRAYHIGVTPHELAPRIIMVGDPARALRVASRFNRVEHEVRHREYVTVTGTIGGQRLSVIGTGIGTDNVEIALVEAVSLLTCDLATGARRVDAQPVSVIRVGTSGGLRDDVESGTLCVSAYAIGLDSTGLYYDVEAADDTVTALEEASRLAVDACIPPGRRFAGWLRPYAARADPALTAALTHAADRSGHVTIRGVTVAAPGFYGPSGRRLDGVVNTAPDIKHALGQIEVDGLAVVNMEMESSLLFHLAQALGIAAATICPVISAPSGHSKVVDYRPYVEASIDIALEALLRPGLR